MKQERLKNKSESVPELLAWVNRSRKLEEKRNSEKEKALMLSKIFEEQVCLSFNSASSHYLLVMIDACENLN